MLPSKKHPNFHMRYVCVDESFRWPSELGSSLESVGFEQVHSESYPLRPKLYAPFMQCHLAAAEEVSFTAMRNDGPDAQGPSFRKLLAEVYEECQTGVTMMESPIVVCGKKPAFSDSKN